ncbi:MAG: UDP-glucose 4-epimerase GalE, partial [Clostridiales bacterium]|nr:UDP-glucose 4-epimerase GalE [Clostridiales bacterium]
MSVLVTGGAGYIGSHCVASLLQKGLDVVIIDNLSRGHREAVTGGRFYKGDLNDSTFLDSVFAQEKITAVIHFAAFSLVGESMQDPGKYILNNVGGSVTLLDAMRRNQVPTIVFSSTAAVYGEPDKTPITEDMRTKPTNTYGESKLMVEAALRWFENAYGIRYAALRYFNVAGAHESGNIGEHHEPETHLIPLVLKAAQEKKPIRVFGNDYTTPDGTCIRDYIHVDDLIDAHVLALSYLQSGKPSGAFNLGLGQGFSVRQIIDSAVKATGLSIDVVESERRAGDPAILIASGDKARRILGWKPTHTNIEEIIASA